MAGTVKKLQFSEGTDVGAPTDLGLATSTTTISEYANDAAYVSANGVATAGDVYINSTLKVLRYYTGSAWRNAVPAMDPTDATKTFLIDISGNTANMSATLTFGASGNRVYTFPDVSITVASRAGTETFTNKTLTAPLITTNGSIDVTGAGTLAIGASVGANNLTLGGAATTVVVAGNLQVDGTTTTVNSTTLEVADAAILVNNGGNDASSEGAGITVERTGTSGSFIYKNTSASKWACGPLGSELDVVTVSATQGISNKTVTASDIDGGTASNTSRITLPKASTATIGGLTRKEGTIHYDTTLGVPTFDNGTTVTALATSSAASQDSPFDIKNYSLLCSVSGNALTIALKDKAGSNPSVGSPVTVAFRNETLATGDYSVVSATSALSFTFSSGSTAGHASGTEYPIYVYLINNAGAIELAASRRWFGPDSIQTTTAEGGAGGADSGTVLYSTTARTSKSCKLIARLLSTQITAGTWAAAPTEILLGNNFPMLPSQVIRFDPDTSIQADGCGSNAADTFVRVYTTTRENIGPAIAPASTTATGDVFTITENGIFSINMSDNTSAGGHQFSISKNFTTAANPNNQPSGANLAVMTMAAGDQPQSMSWTGRLAAGDVIRILADPGTPGTFSQNHTMVSLTHIAMLP